MPMLLFVYGTLKYGFSNHNLLAGATSLGKGKLIGNYALYEDTYGNFPFIVENQEVCSVISGELYEITSREHLASIDEFEGVPSLFIRKPLELHIGAKETVVANVYLWASDVVPIDS